MSRLDGAVEGLAGRGARFVKFNEPGRRHTDSPPRSAVAKQGAALPRRAKARQRDGGWRAAKAEGRRRVRGEVGPGAGHAGGALQAVGDIGPAGEAEEQTAAAVREVAE